MIIEKLTNNKLTANLYNYRLPLESFFTWVLADGFSLEFEWPQVSSSLKDTSHYFDRSQQCCSLYSLHLSRYFRVFQSLYQSFGNCTKSTNYNWYNLHFHVPQFFQFHSKDKVLLFALSQFYSVVRRDSNVHNPASSLFIVD